jgi:hypothetical protein
LFGGAVISRIHDEAGCAATVSAYLDPRPPCERISAHADRSLGCIKILMLQNSNFVDIVL